MTYATSDMGLIGALSLYFPIASVDRSNPKRITFIFEGEDIDAVADSYFRGELKVTAIDYFMKLKTSKNLLYQETYIYK